MPGLLRSPSTTHLPSALAWLARVARVGTGSFSLLALTAAASAAPHTPTTLYLPAVTLRRGLTPPRLLISALYYDTLTAGEPDEAFELWNIGRDPADLAAWSVSDGAHLATFPTLTLPPGHSLWCAYNAPAFEAAFGHLPACEYGPPSAVHVPRLTGPALRFSNAGGRLQLYEPWGVPRDTLVYKTPAPVHGWLGPPVNPWRPTGFSEEGQILYRKLDETSAQPLPDTDRAADWASDPADPLAGRKVRYPAWDPTAWAPLRVDTPATVGVALAPDAAYPFVATALAIATTSIDVAVYSLEHALLADLLANRAAAGVAVTLLLEGSPAGGLSEQARWAAARVAQAGGRVLFMNSSQGVRARYRNQHAKFILLDGVVLLLGSENLTPDAMPDDEKSDGTLGRRGLVLMTDHPTVVAHARALFARDTDRRWGDLTRWQALDPLFGPPPATFVPTYASGGVDYALRAPTALYTTADRFELLQAPENALRHADGLPGLLARAGPGDTILVQQLSEPPWWGPSNSNRLLDPNPRFEAYLAAARRGATVSLLLDRHFDDVTDPRSNRATCILLNDLATDEDLDLQCRTANPTGLGIHNKMVLARIGGEGWVHAGSLNGSETSHKLNRELALQLRSAPLHDFLAAVWQADWDSGR